MKKHILLLFCIVLFGKISLAQFYAGADATVIYPLGYLKSQVDYGYGPKFNLGYSFNNKLDIAFSYELLDFKTMQPDFKIMSETFSVKYKSGNNKYNPYLGVKTGIYHSKVEAPSFINGQTMETSDRKENAFGFAPMAGVLIDAGSSGNWKLDISTAYSILNFKSKYEYLSLNFGAHYLF